MPDAHSVFTRLPDLKSTLRSRLLASPCHEPANDWRLGQVSEARKRRLRKFFPEHPTPAAVLVPLVDRGDDLGILLTLRSSHLKHHAGQISFPGGRIEVSDSDPLGAALRETEEEIGLRADQIEVAGYLPDHLVITGYRVTPVVGFIRPSFSLTPDPTEVVEVFEVPLSFVLDERNHVPAVRRFEGEDVHFIDFPYGHHTIWGATAGMLMTLYRTLRGESV
ncbi:MAG: NUDIX hydrolase [Gammaproteobacteria bacterium]